MTRTILIHLNVTVPDDDPRNADEVGDAIGAALEVGLEGEVSGNLASGDGEQPVRIVLCEEA